MYVCYHSWHPPIPHLFHLGWASKPQQEICEPLCQGKWHKGESSWSCPCVAQSLSVEDLSAVCLGCAMNLSHHTATIRTRLEELGQPDITLRTALDGISEVSPAGHSSLNAFIANQFFDNIIFRFIWKPPRKSSDDMNELFSSQLGWQTGCVFKKRYEKCLQNIPE